MKLKTFLLASLIPLASYAYGPYDSEIIRVVDGDTVEANLNLWPGLYKVSIIRIAHIDTPEIRGTKCEREKVLAHEAKKFVQDWVIDEHAISIRVLKLDSFGRAVGTIEKNGEDLGTVMLDSGYAKVYGIKYDWCRELEHDMAQK